MTNHEHHSGERQARRQPFNDLIIAEAVYHYPVFTDFGKTYLFNHEISDGHSDFSWNSRLYSPIHHRSGDTSFMTVANGQGISE
jgi:hypothetical protein